MSDIDTFDSDKFLDWLDQCEGPVAAWTLKTYWPNFPRDNLVGATGTFNGDQPAYYQRDLRRAANGNQLQD